ncbi:hypothetical protein AB0J82_36670 [Asanoa sp. NPDC049518]|uniref:hypothetical protein n=1 Tax=unclassified Asanoa TaxID=2685164 RepID=UPI003433DE21
MGDHGKHYNNGGDTRPAMMSSVSSPGTDPQREQLRVRAVSKIAVDPAQYQQLHDVDETDADFSGRTLSGLSIAGSRFRRCRFDGLRAGTLSFGGGMTVSEYVECSFDGLRATNPIGGFSRFVRCSFRDVDIKGWSTDYLELVDCRFSGRIRSTVFFGSRLPAAKGMYESMLRFLEREGRQQPPGYRELMLRPTNEFRGNDFSEAHLLDVAWHGVDLSIQTLPKGPDYLYIPDAVDTLERAQRLLAEQPPGADTAWAQHFYRDVLGARIAAGQRQLLLREKDFSRKRDKAAILLGFAVLREANA